MNRFKVTHPWKATGNTLTRVYDTCLVTKIFTFKLPGGCAQIHSSRLVFVSVSWHRCPEAKPQSTILNCSRCLATESLLIFSRCMNNSLNLDFASGKQCGDPWQGLCSPLRDFLVLLFSQDDLLLLARLLIDPNDSAASNISVALLVVLGTGGGVAEYEHWAIVSVHLLTGEEQQGSWQNISKGNR